MNIQRDPLYVFLGRVESLHTSKSELQIRFRSTETDDQTMSVRCDV